MKATFFVATTIVVFFIIWLGTPLAWEGCLYIDSTCGSDANPGTATRPLMTLKRAAMLVNQSSKAAPATIRLAPGIYNLDRTVILQNSNIYTKEKRLTITAQYLPDDPKWNPYLMPTILSTEIPKKTGRIGDNTETYSIKVNMSHVSICGLRFLGNPSLQNYHAVIDRTEADLKDLVVTQCVFIGDRNSLDIYCPIIGAGDELIVDHCVFLNCHASVVFWDGPKGIVGKRNAMRYCIIYGGHISGPWTCQTSDDFECHHNIIADCKFAWMRKPGDRQRYSMKNCVVADCEFFSGCGGPFGPFQSTGDDVTFIKDNVMEEGQVELEQNRNDQKYFQLKQGSLGSDLGAGLFKK